MTTKTTGAMAVVSKRCLCFDATGTMRCLSHYAVQYCSTFVCGTQPQDYLKTEQASRFESNVCAVVRCLLYEAYHATRLFLFLSDRNTLLSALGSLFCTLIYRHDWMTPSSACFSERVAHYNMLSLDLVFGPTMGFIRSWNEGFRCRRYHQIRTGAFLCCSTLMDEQARYE